MSIEEHAKSINYSSPHISFSRNDKPCADNEGWSEEDFRNYIFHTPLLKASDLDPRTSYWVGEDFTPCSDFLFSITFCSASISCVTWCVQFGYVVLRCCKATCKPRISARNLLGSCWASLQACVQPSVYSSKPELTSIQNCASTKSDVASSTPLHSPLTHACIPDVNKLKHKHICILVLVYQAQFRNLQTKPLTLLWIPIFQGRSIKSSTTATSYSHPHSVHTSCV